MARRNKYDIDEKLESPFKLEHLKRAGGYLKPYLGKMLLALLASSLGSIAVLFLPKVTEWVLDEAVPQGDVGMIIEMAGLFVLIILVSTVLTMWRTWLMANVSMNFVYDIRRDMYAHLQKLPFSYFDSRPAGKILVRVINYVNSISDILTNGVINLVLDVVNLCFIAVFMYATEPTLASIVLAGLPLFVAVVFILKPQQRKAWQNYSNKNSNYTAYLAEAIDGVQVSQMFDRQEKNIETMRKLAKDCWKSWMRGGYINNSVPTSSEIITQLVFAAVYIAGVHWLGGGTMVSFGVILAMTQYVSRFWSPITNLANIYNSFVNNIAYLERIFETIDEPILIDDIPDAPDMGEVTGEVLFDDVTFGYEPDITILENFNLHVKENERIALVGPTGAGKSTVINLVCRFYDLNSGHIFMYDTQGNKHDISRVTQKSLRTQLGIMLQDSFVFSDTVMENIRYGRLDATDEEVIQAAKMVHADEFITQMPQGYNTMLRERGKNLSQGQRQLIAFARTMLSNPGILILDEATSSIDTHTEKLLQEGIEAMLHGRTSFIIAHRLSTIRNCDRILYIGNKGIMEAGSHDELMAQKGLYYQLHTTQLKEKEKN